MSEYGTMTDADYETLESHLSKYGTLRHFGEVSYRVGDISCPICSASNWSIPPQLEHGVHVKDKERRMTGVLAVSLVCKECAYIMQFAWHLIRDRYCAPRIVAIGEAT